MAQVTSMPILLSLAIIQTSQQIKLVLLLTAYIQDFSGELFYVVLV
jgi:hypothetical protein